jgi:hypothetical protein
VAFEASRLAYYFSALEGESLFFFQRFFLVQLPNRKMDSEPETNEQIIIEMSELDTAQDHENEEEQEGVHPVMKHAEVTQCVNAFRIANASTHRFNFFVL